MAQQGRVHDAAKSVTARGRGAKISGASVQSLVRGVARIVEGQRRFADEFGLPYSRLFQDGFEAFKGQAPEEVLRTWLSAEGADANRIDQLFSDLLSHQLALVEALATVHQLPKQPLGFRQRLASLFQRAPREPDEASHRSYMEVIAPAFVAAYAGAREQGQARPASEPDNTPPTSHE
ncbi:MAG: hypothetical protein LAT61_00795 [Alcanivorax sp.]|nr:hypothetical protein [Alcanivorax sp.]